MSEVSTRGALTISFGEVCDRGKVREENQDNVRNASIPLGELFIVADGIGGYQGGATASRMVVDGFHGQLAIKPVGYPPEQALQEACTYTNTSIHNAAHSGDATTQRMGSTVVLALLQLGGTGNGPVAWIGHVGDSRAYLIRNGRMQKITSDHSAVQALLNRNLITEEEARNHPDASVLTRSLGHRPEVEIEIDRVALLPGDALLLCSDGLWGYVGDADIAAVVTDPSLSVKTVTDTLLSQALAAGGLDNIGIEYIRVEGNGQHSPVMPDARGRSAVRTGALAAGEAAHDHRARKLQMAAVALLLLGGLGGLGYVVYNKYLRPSNDKIIVKPQADSGEVSPSGKNTANDVNQDNKTRRADQTKKDEKRDNKSDNHTVPAPVTPTPAIPTPAVPTPTGQTPTTAPDGRRQAAVVGESKKLKHAPPIPGGDKWNVVSIKRDGNPDCARFAKESPQVFMKNHKPGIMSEIVSKVPGLKEIPGVAGVQPQEMPGEISAACGVEFEVIIFLADKVSRGQGPAPTAPTTDTVPINADESETDPHTNASHPKTPKPNSEL